MYIENTDALSFLKTFETGSVDMVLTDPPYIISKKSGFKSVGEKGLDRLAISTDYGSWDNTDVSEHIIMLQEVLDECYRVLKDGGVIVVFYDLWKIETLFNLLESAGKGFKSIRFIEWLKTNPVPINSKVTYLSNAREIALAAVKKGKSTFNAEYHNGIFELPIHRDGGKRIHPTQKPVALMKELITLHTKEDEIVIDPFSGSGTTVLASYLLGRVGKGCELDANYCKKANTRLYDILGDIFNKPVWDFSS
jgi:DNA modification methylase